MDKDEFERRIVAAAGNHAGGVRRDLVQISAEMTAADAALRRRRDAVTLTQRAGEFGEDRQNAARPGQTAKAP
jgi:hypothetical protein